jgi:hypothetical protein
MKLSFELPVASELDKYHFIQQETNEVKGLRNVRRFFSCVSHVENRKEVIS